MVALVTAATIFMYGKWIILFALMWLAVWLISLLYKTLVVKRNIREAELEGYRMRADHENRMYLRGYDDYIPGEENHAYRAILRGEDDSWLYRY